LAGHDTQHGKLVEQGHKSLAAQGDTETPPAVVPELVPSEAENGADSGHKGADRLAVIAEVLADLPEPMRAAILAMVRSATREEQ